MCGIFGVFRVNVTDKLNRELVMPIRELVSSLTVQSSIRGRDSSGICVVNDKNVTVFKDKVEGTFIGSALGFRNSLKAINGINTFYSVIGHTRLKTKGSFLNNMNNHPLICGDIVGVHNGMIANDDEVFKDLFGENDRLAEVDSEIIFALINKYIQEGKTLNESIKETSKSIFGSYSCAAINMKDIEKLVLFRNRGDLSIVKIPKMDLVIFASTYAIITKAIGDVKGITIDDTTTWVPISMNQGVIIELGKTYSHTIINLKHGPQNMDIWGWY